MSQPRTLTPEERAEAVRSLRTVGGVYHHLARIVELDDSVPSSHDSSTKTTGERANG